MEGQQETQQQAEHHHHHHRHRDEVQKEGRSRMHRVIRDRVVGSKWFGRLVMFVIIVNSVTMWPWTDASKLRDHVGHMGFVDSLVDLYPVFNIFFILVYLVEFILKVCEIRRLIYVVRVRAICVIDRSRCAINRLIALAMGFLVRVSFMV